MGWKSNSTRLGKNILQANKTINAQLTKKNLMNE